MPDESFPAECRRRFIEAIEARDLAPFHKDKRVYQAEAEQALEDYTDWLAIQDL